MDAALQAHYDGLAHAQAHFFDPPGADRARARAWYLALVGVPAIVALTERFHLPIADEGQDWELLIADGDRVEEWLDAYDSLTDGDERHYLMALIVASLEERLQSGDASLALCARLVPCLKQDFALHERTIAYWARPEAAHFRIGPLMRDFLSRHERSTGNWR